MGGLTGMLLLKRLRRAIAKVRFLLSSSATRWLLVRSGRRVSFKDRQGLLEFLSSSNSNVSEYFDATASPSFRSSSPSPSMQQRQLSRTISSIWTGIVLNRTPSGLSSGAPVVISGTTAEEEAAAVAAASAGGTSRTVSGLSSSGDEDVDEKADEFIRNFRRRLEMERKVSLELRYVRKDSSDSSNSP